MIYAPGCRCHACDWRERPSLPQASIARNKIASSMIRPRLQLSSMRHVKRMRAAPPDTHPYTSCSAAGCAILSMSRIRCQSCEQCKEQDILLHMRCAYKMSSAVSDRCCFTRRLALAASFRLALRDLTRLPSVVCRCSSMARSRTSIPETGDAVVMTRVMD